MKTTAEQLVERDEWIARLADGTVGLLDALLVTLRLDVPAHPLLVAKLEALEYDYQAGRCRDVAEALGMQVERREAAQHERLSVMDTVHRLVEQYLAEGYSTSVSPDRPTCFEKAGDLLGMKETTVRDYYYNKGFRTRLDSGRKT